MINETPVVLGIDTSNYKTSIALVDLDGKLYGDERILLNVPRGERGLRQSDALFQHVMNLPGMLEDMFDSLHLKFFEFRIEHISVSTKPRPVDGSYMPCFNAGVSVARSLAAALEVDVTETSHQEGHIAAIAACAKELPEEFLALHLSGGTCELLKVKKSFPGYDIEIIGGSRDISFGQVLDRTGVALGLDFPSGELMDSVAIEGSNIDYEPVLSRIKVTDSYINLSGIETQISRLIQSGDYEKDKLIIEIFDKISNAIILMLDQAIKSTGIMTALFAGGVSSSRYISNILMQHAEKMGYRFIFGNQAYSSDNAVGVALIGMNDYVNEADYCFETE